MRTKFLFDQMSKKYSITHTCSEGLTTESFTLGLRQLNKKLSTNYYDNTVFGNVTEETLVIAARMFTYLKVCPINPKELILYENILKNSSPKQIIYALLTIIKYSTTNLQKENAKKIFSRIKKEFGLLYSDIIPNFLPQTNIGGHKFCNNCTSVDIPTDVSKIIGFDISFGSFL